MIVSASALSYESPLRADRVDGAGLGEPLGVANREILHAPVRVMDQFVEALAASGAGPDRLLQRVEGEVGAQRAGGLPADDHPRVDVGDERDVDEPRPGADVGQVGDPEPVRGAGDEAAIDEIPRPVGLIAGDRRELRLAAHDTTQPQLAHQPGDACSGRPGRLRG